MGMTQFEVEQIDNAAEVFAYTCRAVVDALEDEDVGQFTEDQAREIMLEVADKFLKSPQ